METSRQISFNFDNPEPTNRITLILKPYIQPFERLLAAAELYGLVADGSLMEPFSRSIDPMVTIRTDLPIEYLRRRLAYWEKIGSWELKPTLQVLLESAENGNSPSADELFRYHKSRKLRYGPHGIHEYRGKFFPQLVRSLVNLAGLSPYSIVLDPMCGSGTTNCEARSMGMVTLGVDLNPLSVKIAKLKTSIFDADPELLRGEVNKVLIVLHGRVGEDRGLDGGSQDDNWRYLERWFSPLALRELAAILTAIRTCPYDLAREFMEVCFSNIIRAISWQKDSDLRVRKEIRPHTIEESGELFEKEVQSNLDKVLSYLSYLKGEQDFAEFIIREGDSRRLGDVLSEHIGQCDFLLTSPPYAMALPYIDTDRLSLSIMGMLPRSSHRTRELLMIGNREISDKQREELWDEYLNRRKELPWNVQNIVERIASANHREGIGFRRKNLPALLGKYFLDMTESMRSAREMMKPDSYGFYVVGNNSTRINGERVEIPTDHLLWEVGKKVGWKPKQMINMELLASRDIFRYQRGTSESILWFEVEGKRRKKAIERKAIYSGNNIEQTDWYDDTWDFHDEDTQEHLHALHPYPARFIPQIPRKAIRQWSSPGDVVLDPFCGCGTTLLESILAGRPAIGVDNNDVAVLISKAKCSYYTRDDVYTINEFLDSLGDYIHNSRTPLVMPDYANFSYWFHEVAKQDLARLRLSIQQLPDRPRLLAMAVFSSIIVRASNQDSDTRYARIKRNYDPGSAIDWFKSRLADTVTRLKDIIDRAKADVLIECKDSRDLSFIDDESVNLIVTSPPYINAYDYHKYHRHRLHWMDGNVAFARDSEIGGHDVFTRPKATPDRYFEDMSKCFYEWARVLTHDGRAFIVVGDGIVSGNPVPVGDIFIRLCEKVGLKFTNRWIRNLHKNKKSFNQSARIDREHLLLFTRIT